MLARDYRERVSRVLDCGQWENLLGPRCGLLWRTHDAGLMRFRCDRLHSRQLREMERLLKAPTTGGKASSPQPERAVFPLRLLYALSAGRVPLSGNPEADTLPGCAALVQAGEDLFCLSADPELTLQALAKIEAEERDRLLGRLIGTPAASGEGEPDRQTPHCEEEGVSCGRCGLLGKEHCTGGACVNSRTDPS